MSDELKAAAERLRDLSGDVRDCLEGNLPHDSPTYRGTLLFQVTEAALVLLSEHPADDDLPVTEEWLLSVGFESHAGCLARRIERGSLPWIEVIFDDDGGYMLMIGSEAVWDGLPQPRGDVRRLCRALGIQLKDSPCDTPA